MKRSKRKKKKKKKSNYDEHVYSEDVRVSTETTCLQERKKKNWAGTKERQWIWPFSLLLLWSLLTFYHSRLHWPVEHERVVIHTTQLQQLSSYSRFFFNSSHLLAVFLLFVRFLFVCLFLCSVLLFLCGILPFRKHTHKTHMCLFQLIIKHTEYSCHLSTEHHHHQHQHQKQTKDKLLLSEQCIPLIFSESLFFFLSNFSSWSHPCLFIHQQA